MQFQPGGAFKTLTIEGDLNGSGMFAMNTNLASEQGDLLQVLGSTNGSHTLFVADSGNEPSGPNGELLVVDTNNDVKGGNGTFALHGQHVDAGAFRYTLEQQGDDWFLRNTALVPVQPDDGPRLDPRPNTLSDGANAALGNQSATATLWSAEMNALVKRLGELRMGEDNGGVWARGIGKTFEVDNGSSRGYDQNVHGLEVGADTAIALNGGKLYVGGMIGAATSDQDFGDGSSGTIDSKLIGAYATWLDDNGYYVDTVAKYNRLDNEVKTLSNTGEQVKGSYDTDGYGADVEVGKHIKLQDGWFIEPQAELTYTHTEGADYTASNGLNVEAADSDSLQGRVGALFGKSMKLDNGMTAQPYVKASYVHEFNGDSSVTVNGFELDNQVSGSRSEIGFGSVLQVSEKTKVSLDVEHAKGNSVEEPWAVNIGVRFLW
ncbi:Pertactin autotransporter [compost metagenome]